MPGGFREASRFRTLEKKVTQRRQETELVLYCLQVPNFASVAAPGTFEKPTFQSSCRPPEHDSVNKSVMLVFCGVPARHRGIIARGTPCVYEDASLNTLQSQAQG